MLNRSLRQSRLIIVGFAIAVVAGFCFAAPTLSAAPLARSDAMFVNLGDTGKVVALRVGQHLVVKLPMRDYHDAGWHVTKISPGLKLIGGPDELRPVNWSPWKLSFQIFYFERESPGSMDLVMEPNYFLKPLVLKIVD